MHIYLKKKKKKKKLNKKTYMNYKTAKNPTKTQKKKKYITKK
jgi:hypothetical protein